MQIGTLRCKSPELVRKEIWTHVLAYNLIHTIAAQAASTQEVQPRTISFKATMQTLIAFQPFIATQVIENPNTLNGSYQAMLSAIASQRGGDRPDRYEPRRIKRRKGKYDLLTKPRHDTKLDILNGITA